MALICVAPGLLAFVGFSELEFARCFAHGVPEVVMSLIGALMFLVLPVDWTGRRFTLTWDQALNIDWGVILLFGGGLAMGDLAFSTGLAKAMGTGIAAWLPSQETTALTMLFTGAAIVLSETTSNTAA